MPFTLHTIKKCVTTPMSVLNYYFENKAYDSKGIDINEQIIQKNCGNSLGKIFVESRNLDYHSYKSSLLI